MEPLWRTLVALALFAIGPIAFWWLFLIALVAYSVPQDGPVIDKMELTALAASGGYGLWGAATAARHVLTRAQSFRNRVVAQIALIAGAVLTWRFGFVLLAENSAPVGKLLYGWLPVGAAIVLSLALWRPQHAS
jgi:hypothetical protein